MASLHINVIRTFIPCSTGTQAAKLTDADGNVSPAYLEKIDQFLAAAWQQGIRTIFCFEFDEKTLARAEGAVWRAAIRAVVGRYRSDGRVLLWDLMNEPEARHWSAVGKAFLKSAMPYVKELDDRHLTTVGIGWEIDRLAELGLPDVLQYHEYAPKKELFADRVKRVGKTIDHMRKVGGDRPLVIGEFGMSTARDPLLGAGSQRGTCAVSRCQNRACPAFGPPRFRASHVPLSGLRACPAFGPQRQKWAVADPRG